MTKNWGRKCLGKKLLPQECTCSEGAQLGSLLAQKRNPCFAAGAGGLAESAVTKTLRLAPRGLRLRLPALQPARNADGEEFLLGHPARAFACQVFLNYFSRQFTFLWGCFLPFPPVFSFHILILLAIICTSSWRETKFFSPCALFQNRMSPKPAGVTLTCDFNSGSQSAFFLPFYFMFYMPGFWRVFSPRNMILNYSFCLECHFSCIYYLDVLHVSFTLPLLILSSYQLPLCSASFIVRIFSSPTSPLLLMQNLSTPFPGAGWFWRFLLGNFLESKATISLATPALIREKIVRWTVFRFCLWCSHLTGWCSSSVSILPVVLQT